MNNRGSIGLAGIVIFLLIVVCAVLAFNGIRKDTARIDAYNNFCDEKNKTYDGFYEINKEDSFTGLMKKQTVVSCDGIQYVIPMSDNT